MFQNYSTGINSCGCNEYSLLTANTGIVLIENANTRLTGLGSLPVFTAVERGAIIKAITVKAIQSTSTGMVRFFIANRGREIYTLYKEVPVPTDPKLIAVPLPEIVLPTFEYRLPCNLKLEQEYSLCVSTQNAESFNIIVEGLNWIYPATLPSSPSNFVQKFANTALGIVSYANPNLDGSGIFSPVFTSDATKNGAFVKSITVKAMQSTHPGMVRFFIVSPDSQRNLIKEVPIPQTEQSSYIPSFKQTIPVNYYLQAGYGICATTQLSESFAITIEGDEWSYPIS